MPNVHESYRVEIAETAAEQFEHLGPTGRDEAETLLERIKNDPWPGSDTGVRRIRAVDLPIEPLFCLPGRRLRVYYTVAENRVLILLITRRK